MSQTFVKSTQTLGLGVKFWHFGWSGVGITVKCDSCSDVDFRKDHKIVL